MLINENHPKARDLDICTAYLPSISQVSRTPIFTFCCWDSIADIFLFNNTGFSNRVGIAMGFKHDFFSVQWVPTCSLPQSINHPIACCIPQSAESAFTYPWFFWLDQHTSSWREGLLEGKNNSMFLGKATPCSHISPQHRKLEGNTKVFKRKLRRGGY